MDEPTTVGLTEEGHSILRRLKDDGAFGDMADAYRFAVALAVAHGAEGEQPGVRRTIFNVGTLDPERSLYLVVKSLLAPEDEPVYKAVERLAEWGVRELGRLSESGSIDMIAIFDEVQELLGASERRPGA